jgi:uncharacterized protein (DUF3820 family)
MSVIGTYSDDTPIFFGKYKGTKLANVPNEYLIYLWDSSNQGKTLYDQKLAAYIKENLEAIKIGAIAEKQRRYYSRH